MNIKTFINKNKKNIFKVRVGDEIIFAGPFIAFIPKDKEEEQVFEKKLTLSEEPIPKFLKNNFKKLLSYQFIEIENIKPEDFDQDFYNINQQFLKSISKKEWKNIKCYFLKSPYPAMKFEISTGTIYILGYRS